MKKIIFKIFTISQIEIGSFTYILQFHFSIITEMPCQTVLNNKHINIIIDNIDITSYYILLQLYEFKLFV